MLLATLVLSSGCGRTDLHTVPAGGRVLFKGKPVAGAVVTFVSSGGETRVAGGETDADGRFRLTTHAGPRQASPGAVPGGHRVVVQAFVPPDGMTEQAYQRRLDDHHAKVEREGFLAAGEPPAARVPALPTKYSDLSRTTLEARVVADGPNDFTFELE